MNIRLLLSSSVVVVLVALAGCWARDPCGDGLVVGDDYQCYPIPAAPVADAASTDGGADGAEAAPASSFGKPCTATTDCGGDAPFCAAPQLPYCTQIMCAMGEANAGACPAGFVCMSNALGSACVKTS